MRYNELKRGQRVHVSDRKGVYTVRDIGHGAGGYVNALILIGTRGIRYISGALMLRLDFEEVE